MHYLSHYTEAAMTKAIDEAGAFFAFSNQQFNEQKKEGVKYVSMRMGLICPKANADKLAAAITRAGDEGRAADLAENGKQGIIHRELGNHEACIRKDITDTVDALAGYGITKEEVQAEFCPYLDAHHK